MNKKPRAGARSINKSKRRKRSAVWTSVNIVLGAMSHLHRHDRRAARARARCELEALSAGVELVNPSGVDWAYWEKRFAEMPIAVRETTAAREIVPLLLGRDATPASLRQTSSPPLHVQELGDGSPITIEEIRKARKALEERFSLPAPDNKPATPAPASVSVDMSADELDVLVAARARARARVDCG